MQTFRRLQRLVVIAVRGAPPAARRRMAAGMGAVVLVLVAAVVDTLTGSPGREGFRLAALLLTASGIAMLTIAHAVRAAGQPAGGASHDSIYSSAPLHFTGALEALPPLGLFATAAFAAATGLLAAAAQSPAYAMMAGLPLALAWLSGRELLRITHFMYAVAGERARVAARAENEAAAARLSALQAQLEPHFLFNALNTIASLVRTDPHASEAMVEHLATVLRRSLVRSRHPLSTLREETDFVRAYLAIEQQRWGDALRVEWCLDPALLDRRVPTMCLQPLVENALKHGVSARSRGGVVRIEARPDGVAALRLLVQDDGPGFRRNAVEGFGLGNLRRRMQTLYADNAALWVSSRDGLTAVTVRLPFLELSRADAAAFGNALDIADQMHGDSGVRGKRAAHGVRRRTTE